jgi:serine/threonine-protein kinase
MAQAVQGLSTGDVIQDTYRIQRLLGEGGMGATFLGENITTGHQVAIKVMSSEFARNSKAVDLFKRESQLLRTVQSDAVARYETTLRDSTGRLFLVMEYIPGKSLADYIKKGARLNAEDVAKLGLRLATGLAALHRLNIVHRDIAPDNIQVPDDNIMGSKLIDFGLASDTIGTEKSIIGDSRAGKYSFMAPEQMGMHGGKATAATDIYALGLVLLRISGHRVPGEGQDVGALEARRKDLSLAKYGLPPDLTKVLSKMLRSDPTKRPTDVVPLFRSAIEALQKKDTTVSTAPKRAIGDPTPKKSYLKWGLAVVIIVIAASGISLQMVKYFDEPVSLGTKQSAESVLASSDPETEVARLIATGDPEALEVAYAVLKQRSLDRGLPDEQRITALIGVAEMLDPLTYSKATSPFLAADPVTARREYQRAADLGSDPAKRAVERLKDAN